MARKWIQKAIKNPGSLRATARRAGLIKGDENISLADIRILKKSKNPTTRRRANLAQTLRKLRKK